MVIKATMSIHFNGYMGLYDQLRGNGTKRCKIPLLAEISSQLWTLAPTFFQS